jgi:hypothetical protein
VSRTKAIFGGHLLFVGLAACPSTAALLALSCRTQRKAFTGSAATVTADAGETCFVTFRFITIKYRSKYKKEIERNAS